MPRTYVRIPFGAIHEQEGYSRRLCSILKNGKYDDPAKPSKYRNRGFGWTIEFDKKTKIVILRLTCNNPGLLHSNWCSFCECLMKSGFERHIALFTKYAQRNKLIQTVESARSLND